MKGQKLCKTCGITYREADSKATLAVKLVAKIKEVNLIPHPDVLAAEASVQPASSRGQQQGAAVHGFC